MNKYLKKLNKLEFVVTYSCTGKCKHCSEGGSENPKGFISPDTAARLVSAVTAVYEINSVMTFGGEPLLFPETVYAVHNTALELGIEKRTLITNGFFTSDNKKISDVSKRLSDCGINNVLLSVDAFHQETIPLELVKKFAEELKSRGVPLKVHPAWLVTKEHNNPYNSRTKELLAEFMKMGISVSEGNDIIPSGNALKYLGDYYDLTKKYINPYDENPEDIRTISFDPSGRLLGGNFYENDIMEILENYTPNIFK